MYTTRKPTTHPLPLLIYMFVCVTFPFINLFRTALDGRVGGHPFHTVYLYYTA